MSEEKPAVWIQNAYKRYTPSSVVLRGLNMKVMKGTIYGLLGPSGCGKTTLLSCIVGQRTLDSGDIYVSVNHKSHVGYMPQEVALNIEFTISEVFYFYGRIYGMTDEKIISRGNELIRFLELPPLERLIVNCSGGQQRRVSMAVTLLNNPKLLILDEPTVGVDPLLCHSIWEYFLDLVRQHKKTIIITTHYIEEAKNANCIGLMRGGYLLAEEPPSVLLRQYNCNSLEEVFLKLSVKQENSDSAEEPIFYPKIQPNAAPLQSKNNLNKERLKAQLVKDFNWTRRNWSITLFVICLPSLLFIILGQLRNKDGSDFIVGDVPLAIVNFETDNCRNSTPYLQLSSQCQPTRPISCRYIDHLNELFKITNFNTEEDALKAVKKNRCFAIVTLPVNFSQNMQERLDEQTHASEAALDGSIAKASFDMTDFGKSVRSIRELGVRLIEILKEICEECGYSKKLADIPLTVMDYVYEKRDLFQSALPPYYSSVAFYTVMMFTSSSIIMERRSGSFERSQVAGLTMTEIVIAHVVIQIGIMIIQNVISYVILFIFNGYAMVGSYMLSFFIIIMVQVCGMSYGFLLAAIITEEKNVTYAGIFTVLSLFMMTGTMWPIEGIHWILRPLSRINPVTVSSAAYYNVSLRGWTIAKFGVNFGIIYSLCGTLFFITLTYFAVRFGLGTFS